MSTKPPKPILNALVTKHRIRLVCLKCHQITTSHEIPQYDDPVRLFTVWPHRCAKKKETQ